MTGTIQEVMTRIAQELENLADMAMTLQHQLSPCADAGIEVETFQSLDTVTQTLSSLASFVVRLRLGMACTCPVTLDAALADIPLFGLAQRLRGSGQDEVAEECWQLF